MQYNPAQFLCWAGKLISGELGRASSEALRGPWWKVEQLQMLPRHLSPRKSLGQGTDYGCPATTEVLAWAGAHVSQENARR